MKDRIRCIPKRGGSGCDGDDDDGGGGGGVGRCCSPSLITAGGGKTIGTCVKRSVSSRVRLHVVSGKFRKRALNDKSRLM